QTRQAPCPDSRPTLTAACVLGSRAGGRRNLRPEPPWGPRSSRFRHTSSRAVRRRTPRSVTESVRRTREAPLSCFSDLAYEPPFIIIPHFGYLCNAEVGRSGMRNPSIVGPHEPTFRLRFRLRVRCKISSKRGVAANRRTGCSPEKHWSRPTAPRPAGRPRSRPPASELILQPALRTA